MLFIRIVLSLCVLSISTELWAYSNLIILGDSLTDTGNYPQSTHLYEERYDDIAQYTFIPATNPVNTSSGQPLTIEGRVFEYPIEDNPDYLLPMTALDATPRQYRSLNWTYYLVRALFDEAHKVIPERMKAYGIKLNDPNISINYAWWAAVTEQGCHDDEYHFISKKCDFNTLYKHSLSSSPETILIPGLLSQVDLIKADIQANEIYHDDDTLYILYAGGNGLYQAQMKWGKPGLSSKLKAIDLIHGGGAKDMIKAIDILSGPPVNAKHFLVLNLYDLSYTPRLIDDTSLKIVAQLYSRLFNRRLDNLLSDYTNQHPTLDIHLFNNNAFFEKWANADFFSQSLGKQCDENKPTSPYYQTKASTNNCMIDKKHGFLFWNNSHPSGLLHALLASEIHFYLKNLNLA